MSSHGREHVSAFARGDQKEGVGFPEAGVTGDCERANMGAVNRIHVLSKNSLCP